MGLVGRAHWACWLGPSGALAGPVGRAIKPVGRAYRAHWQGPSGPLAGPVGPVGRARRACWPGPLAGPIGFARVKALMCFIEKQVFLTRL